MENYEKGEVKELEDHVNMQCVLENAVRMNVNAGSKIHNLMRFAEKKMNEPDTRQLTWNGCGQSISKAISCAEIMKRQFTMLHQVTEIRFKRIEEYWEPKTDGMDRLKVNRDIPVVTILLSKDPVDTAIPGYQAPESAGTFCHADTSAASKSAAETRTRKQRRHYLSGEIRSKFPDFPGVENRRDKLKQRDKPQQHKKTASNVVEKPKLSSSSDVVDTECRTDGTEEKMDVLQ